MSSTSQINFSKLQVTLRALTEGLAKGDYEGVCGMARTTRVKPADLERVVREYGRHLVVLPAVTLRTIDIVPISDSNPQRWSVIVPLWTQEEGRSDLSLELTIEDSAMSLYSIEIDDLHVL